MSRDSGGNYTLAANNPVASGTTIESGWANNTLDDLAEAMTDSLSRTGKGLMSVPFRGVDGTQGAPGLAFVNESGTGFYRNGTGDLIATALGEPIARINSTFGFQMFVNGVWVTPANSESGDAIAANVSYDNSGSGLTATQVQQAIDELVTQATTGVRIQGTWNPSTNTISGDPAGNVAITKGASPSGYTNPAGVGYAISEDGTFDLNDSGSDTMLKGNTIIWSEGGASQWNQTASSSYATNVVYDNTNTGLVAENVQDALDEGIPYAKAGRKNYIINGDFRIWQRGDSFPSGTEYTADRWKKSDTGASVMSVVKTANGSNDTEWYARVRVTTTDAGSNCYFNQFVEDVRTLQGKTVTLSIDMSAADPKELSLFLVQNFGSGGSTAVNTALGTFTPSTGRDRYSFTVTLPSTGGKTIGAGSYLQFQIAMDGEELQDYRFFHLQLEEGTEATSFEYRPEAEELALCQRYYEKSYQSDVAPGTANVTGALRMNTGRNADNGRSLQTAVQFKVAKRDSPTMRWYSTTTGASGQAVKLNHVAGAGGDIAVSSSNTGEWGVSVGCVTNDALQAGFRLQFTADAEL